VRLALDATPLLGTPTGIGTFTMGAFDGLSRRPEIEAYGYALSWRGRGSLREILPGTVTSGWAVPAGPLLRLWAHTDLVPAEWLIDVDGGIDVVHGTNFVVPPTRRAARVVTVHDLTCVRFPELCAPASLRYPALIRRAVAGGAWVHTPSAFVAAEVCEAFDLPPERVRCVHHGLPTPGDCSLAPDLDAAARLSGGHPYVLALGTVEPRKDLPLLVRAFDRVAAEHPDHRLVIAGGDGWGTESLTAAVAQARHGDRVVRAGYVEPETRMALMAGASVLAFCPRYEGFGLPPLEAMAAGVPVVATAAGAVPEVCGAAATLVPVGDEEALAAGLAEAIDGLGATGERVAAGRAHAATFTWDRCAEGLASLYGDAVRDRDG